MAAIFPAITLLPGGRRLAADAVAVLAAAVGLVLLVAVPGFHGEVALGTLVAFHTAAELASVTICLLIFSVGREAALKPTAGQAHLVSAAFLAAAVLDLVHMLSYSGMPALVTPSGGGKAIAPFLAARVSIAMAMLALAWLPYERLGRLGHSRATYPLALGLALALSVASIVDTRLPQLFMRPGVGLTALKIGVEYLIVAAYVAAAIGLARASVRHGPLAARVLPANLMMALSEFCFTLYSTPADHYFNYGHVLKIVAYLMLWRTLYLEVVLRPYEELKQAEQRATEQAVHYKALFDHTLTGVAVYHRQGSILNMNPAGRHLLEIPPEGEPGPYGRYLDESDPRLLDIRQALDEAGMARGELRMVTTSGRMVECEIEAAVYLKGPLDLAMIAFWDISERLQARREILELNASLEMRVQQRTRQLEMANQELLVLSYAIAHDLRQPIAALKLMHGALAPSAATSLSKPDLALFTRIGTTAQNMDEMAQKLLDLGRLSQTQIRWQELHLDEMAHAILDDLQLGEPARNVTIEVQPGLRCYGDGDLVRSLMENLLGNAWKFTRHRADASIEVGCSGPPEACVFHVRDNGVGFDPENASDLFKPFGRLHREDGFEGHGVGLASVSRIARLHGGKVWARSTRDEGAAFFFQLTSGSTASEIAPAPA